MNAAWGTQETPPYQNRHHKSLGRKREGKTEKYLMNRWLKLPKCDERHKYPYLRVKKFQAR
jgi:hypothetical protein